MNFNSIPETAGVYILLRKNKPLYVGQSRNLRNRIRKHQIKEFDDWEISVFCNHGKKRRRLERELIAKLNPPRNGNLIQDVASLCVSRVLHRKIKARANLRGVSMTKMAKTLIRIGLSHEADMIPTNSK